MVLILMKDQNTTSKYNDGLVERLKKDIENGESQEIEFMEDFPSNVHEIAREIAAFATSNPGTIYMGIADNKRITGICSIREYRKTEDKDLILNRLAGIAQKTVRPPIKVAVDFIDYENKILIRISVPKGVEPVYYSSDIPYIRAITTSERATPDQAKELHRVYFLGQDKFGKADETVDFLVEISFQLSDLQILWSDHENRISSPDIEQLQYDIGDTGRVIMRLNTDTESNALGLSNSLQELGDLLEEMEYHRFLIDGGMSLRNFWNKGDRALGLANAVLSQILGKRQIQEKYSGLFEDKILENINELRNCWRRKDQYQKNRNLPMLQDTLRRLAYNFNRYGNLFSQSEDQSIGSQLREIATALRELSSQEYFAGYLGMNPIEGIKSRMDEIIEISKDVQDKIMQEKIG
jgi:hypothetical protein